MIFINDKKLKISKFPNGESCILKKDVLALFSINKEDIITIKFESDEDFMSLMFVKRVFDYYEREATLLFMYLPYSRMDRSEDKVFTLKYISEFINSLDFKEVILVEPHSDVSPALFDRCSILWTCRKWMHEIKEIIEDEYEKEEEFVFVFPDAGAQKRYEKHVKDTNYLTGFKIRDFASGDIKSLEILGEVPKKGFRALIVDDLCSRGGTFMLTAEKLKDLGASDVRLLVCHCEDTIYDGDVLKTDAISMVYTTNSILSKVESDKLTVLNLKEEVSFKGEE